MAVIGRFRSDLLITCKTDGNFGNVFVGGLFSKGHVSTKTVVSVICNKRFEELQMAMVLTKSNIPLVKKSFNNCNVNRF